MKARRKYSIDQIIEAALAETAEHGLDGVTIRSIATRLNAAPMSLYRYFDDRDQLINLVVDASQAQLVLPPLSSDAPNDMTSIRSWLQAAVKRSREQMLKYPGVADHLLLNGPTGPHTLAFMADVCVVIRRTGRTAEQTGWAYDWLMSTVAVYVSKQTRITPTTQLRHLADDLARRAAAYVAQRRDLAEVIATFAGDADRAFQRVTDTVIDVIVSDVDRPGSPHPP